MESSANDWSRHWLRWVTLIWLAAAAWFLWERWSMIHWYALPDTDDNLRMQQVHDWLAGQGWYDLRQHRLNPPEGFNIHWSRLVDLPIAGLELISRPFLGIGWSQRFAAGVAPILPLWVALTAAALVARRLIDRRAFAISAVLVLTCGAAMLMFKPMRVDHHSWQLALLMLTIAGLADDKPARGGLTMGLSSAASLVIGLELIPFLAISGAAAVLRWVWEGESGAARIRTYGLALAGGCALGYLGFASYDNAVARCDVLSPVWLSTMVAAGSLAFLLAGLAARDWRLRLAAAALGGVALAVFFALAFPQCLGRPEQISPELASKWFNNIREAKPLYTQDWQVALAVIALPMAGVIGSVWAAWRARGTAQAGPWATVALVSIVSLLLVLWQTRQGPAAQFMGVAGAAWLIWTLVPGLLNSGSVLARTLGVVAVVLWASGLGVPLVVPWVIAIPDTLATVGIGKPRIVAPPTAREQAIDKANKYCPTLPALHPIAMLPATTIFTFVDLGPRLIATTHHRAIAGPYHRNGDAILDVHHAFDGNPGTAHGIMLKHGATLLLTCPNLSESTVYRARSPKGFYARLAEGERFSWLEPMPLPKDSPYLLWRIR